MDIHNSIMDDHNQRVYENNTKTITAVVPIVLSALAAGDISDIR